MAKTTKGYEMKLIGENPRFAHYAGVKSARLILFLEEEIKTGGMGMLLSEALRELGSLEGKQYSIMALENAFIRSEKDKTVYESAGLSADDILKGITVTGDNR